MTMASLEALHDTIAAIFDQVQISLANHRKNSVALAKAHAHAVKISQTLPRGSQSLTGERRFKKAFVDMLARVLVVKKGVQPADRVVKFVGAYVAYISAKGLSLPTSSSSSRDNEESDTPVSRFVADLLKFLLKGFQAKDKNVRFRSVSTVAELVSHLGELDEDIYDQLRCALLERRRDKEAFIRSQAILALAKLMDSDSEEDEEDGEETIMSCVLDSLCSDGSPEVRRVALVNLPLTPVTLPIILTRTRDVDPCVRYLVFSKSLRHFNPAQLTISQRETLVRDGLGDRDDKVKAAAADVVDDWFDIARGENKADFLSDIMQFLALFDLTDDNGLTVASDALRSIFATKAPAVRKVVFPVTYWRELTPEAAVFARCYIEYTSSDSVEASCSGIGLNTSRMMEDAGIPVVMAFAFFVQENCNLMLDVNEELETLKAERGHGGLPLDEEQNSVLEQCEQELVQRVCILGEILKIACCLDYSDELGRRKMFLVIRSMIGVESLPESLVDQCLEVLKVMTDDREMIKVTVEVMGELRDHLFDEEDDSNGQDESPSDVEAARVNVLNTSRLGNSKRPTRELSREEELRLDEIDLRCLIISIAMLKRVHGRFNENSALEGIVNDLIVPSIKRVESVFRELGLIALGLCCLIAKDMALQSFPLFCSQVQRVPERLKPKVLQIVLDILLMHSDVFFHRSQETTDQILSFLLQTFEEEESPDIRAVICTGLSKLMLNGIVTDTRVLAALVLAFVAPANSDNQQLRQCLSFFIPAYCYSSYANQTRMQSIFWIVFDLVSQAYEEMEEEETMITPVQFCALFVDWTDPQKRASGSSSRLDSDDTHFNLATDILKACYDDQRTFERKSICHVLSKLYLPMVSNPCSLLCLRTLLENLEQCSVEDPIIQKALEKFGAKAIKQYSKQLKAIQPHEHTDDPRYIEILNTVRATEISDYQDAEQASDESDPENELLRGRMMSPMKPSTRRKARSTSTEIEDDTDDADSASHASPPSSRSPSPLPSSLSSSTPSPVNLLSGNGKNEKMLAFKVSKRIRTSEFK
ncbi:nuclear condensing complex subunit [Irpex rosettiformis]|uniref:Nuclear condensing complex subunit n=1 Tax=Irpex rosettiformis TaxID=378272 RepID=A0ACB8UDD2_9APHY|nr:nuclear condensing complex subunit [Irpex rosettiformis]